MSTLQPGDRPVALVSAGIGVTPVLAMLHALAVEASTREILWLCGAHSGREHPFAEETRSLLKALTRSHSHIRYSWPDAEDRPNVDFDAPGRVNMPVLQELSLPRDSDFYICGPSTFVNDLTAGLAARASRQIAFTPSFSAPSHPSRRASPRRRAGRPPAWRTDWQRTAGFVRPDRFECPLPAGPNRYTRRRQCVDLLLATRGRRRH